MTKMSMKGFTGLSGQFHFVTFLLSCPCSHLSWAPAPGSPVSQFLQLIDAFLLFHGDPLLVLCDRRKVRPCQGDDEEGKWRGLCGQSMWELPGRSWGSQPLTLTPLLHTLNFSRIKLLIPVSTSLSTPGETPSSLHACEPLWQILQDSARELRISSQPTLIPIFSQRDLKLPSGDRGGTFSPCLQGLKAKNSGCLGQ